MCISTSCEKMLQYTKWHLFTCCVFSAFIMHSKLFHSCPIFCAKILTNVWLDLNPFSVLKISQDRNPSVLALCFRRSRQNVWNYLLCMAELLCAHIKIAKCDIMQQGKTCLLFKWLCSVAAHFKFAKIYIFSEDKWFRFHEYAIYCWQ